MGIAGVVDAQAPTLECGLIDWADFDGPNNVEAEAPVGVRISSLLPPPADRAGNGDALLHRQLAGRLTRWKSRSASSAPICASWCRTRAYSPSWQPKKALKRRPARSRPSCGPTCAGAGFAGGGANLANAWRTKIFRDSTSSAALIYTRTPDIIDRFENAQTVTAHSGRYLAWPTAINLLRGRRDGGIANARVTTAEMVAAKHETAVIRTKKPGLSLWCLKVQGRKWPQPEDWPREQDSDPAFRRRQERRDPDGQDQVWRSPEEGR